MAKKNQELIDAVAENMADSMDRSQTFNPLLVALRNNDKRHLFRTNVTTVFIKTGFPLYDYYFGAVINIHDELGNLIGQEPRIGQAAGTFNLLIGNSGSGKGNPNSMKIPTPNGYKRIGDLKVGDEVFTYDGSITTIDGVYPRGEMDIYKVELSDGRYSLCTEDHLWDVFTESHGKLKRMTLDLKTILSDYKRFDDPNSYHRRYKIPALEAPVQYPHKDVPVNPYVIGAFIGNGCLTLGVLQLSSGNEFVPTKLAKILGCKTTRRSEYNYTYDFFNIGPDGKKHYLRTKDVFRDTPEIVGYSYDKCIPEVYLYNDYDTRIALLQGLMDTDGTITEAEGRYNVSYSSTSKKLLTQMLELIRSLGFNGTIGEDNRNSKYTSGYCGNLHFQVPDWFKERMFTLPYKALKGTDAKTKGPARSRNYNVITIKEIYKTHKEQATCIHVTDKSHLYVASQFIVTHNTTLGAQIAGNIIRQYTYANAIHFDCEQRFDVSRCETITKLPASFFDTVNGERYMIKSGSCGLDIIQEMIVKMYVQKMKLKDQLTVPSGFKDEFGRDVMMLQPTVILIDSITTVLNETFNPDSAKEAAEAEGLRNNTEGARDAKTLKGFFKDIIPLCKEAGITIYGINHINSNMSMNAFIPVSKQQNYLKQDESIPGGKTMIYYPFNIVKLTAKPSDDFTEEGDGFAGHMVMVEPIKSSSNQSGNNSKGISFELVFSHKEGFDNLRSMIMYGRDHGLIEGNKARLKFRDDPNCTFTWRHLEQEKDEKPIYENIKKFIIPTLNQHLPFIEPSERGFDNRSLDY